MVSVHQLFCKCDPRLVNFSSALDGASCAQANLLKSWKVVPGTWSQIMKSSLNILQCLRMSLLQVYILDKSSHTSSKFRVSEHSPLSDCSDVRHCNSSLWKLQSSIDQFLIDFAWYSGWNSCDPCLILSAPQPEESKEWCKVWPEY